MFCEEHGLPMFAAILRRVRRGFLVIAFGTGLAAVTIGSTGISGCCACRTDRSGNDEGVGIDSNGMPTGPITDERFLSYYWWGELPECELIEIDRVEVRARDEVTGKPQQQIKREIELDLGRAALHKASSTDEHSSESVPDSDIDTPVQASEIRRPDGILGIQRTKAGFYVGTAFAFADPSCRN
jgi:hypothetical protein